MRKAINSLPEAKEEMERLAAFAQQTIALGEQMAALNAKTAESIEALQSYFDLVDGLMGGAKATRGKAPKPARGTVVKLHSSGYRLTKQVSAPLTVMERVLVIMRDLDRPVLPKDIANDYLQRGWPHPKKGTPYNLISGMVAYLHGRKGVLIKGSTGYTLKPHKDLSELIKAPLLPRSEKERVKARAWAKARYMRLKAEKEAQAADENDPHGATLPLEGIQVAR